MLGSLDFHRYTGNIVEPNIVKSRFCSIQFAVIFAGIQKVGNIIKSTIVNSGNCTRNVSQNNAWDTILHDPSRPGDICGWVSEVFKARKFT